MAATFGSFVGAVLLVALTGALLAWIVRRVRAVGHFASLGLGVVVAALLAGIAEAATAPDTGLAQGALGFLLTIPFSFALLVLTGRRRWR